jgi:Gram-negative bacterial TonB protein C-terminal
LIYSIPAAVFQIGGASAAQVPALSWYRIFFHREPDHYEVPDMGKPPIGLLTTILLAGALAAQEPGLRNLKTVVIATAAQSDSQIVIAPSTSVRFDLKTKEKTVAADAVDLPKWLNKQAALNGLEATGLAPWHIVIAYDQFDEDGDNVHSGVYEEFWASPKKFKRSYDSDDFKQTDYATAQGLYRLGDQRWPNRAQLQVRAEVVAPLSYAATLSGVRAKNVQRSFNGDHKLDCVWIVNESGISDPTQYCFELASSLLRYSRGFGWFQTAFNNIVSFQGHYVAQEVDVTDGGKPYLKLRVQRVETLPSVDDAIFTPPRDAAGPIGERVSGVNLAPIDMATYPEWPASLRTQHFRVRLEIVVGKDGHVLNAHAILGPPDAFKAAERAVRKWTFKPYLVLDQPVEVEQLVELSSN